MRKSDWADRVDERAHASRDEEAPRGALYGLDLRNPEAVVSEGTPGSTWWSTPTSHRRAHGGRWRVRCRAAPDAADAEPARASGGALGEAGLASHQNAQQVCPEIRAISMCGVGEYVFVVFIDARLPIERRISTRCASSPSTETLHSPPASSRVRRLVALGQRLEHLAPALVRQRPGAGTPERSRPRAPHGQRQATRAVAAEWGARLLLRSGSGSGCRRWR